MQKNVFLGLATIFIAIVTVPTMCMELASPSTEIPTIFVKLHLKEVAQSETNESWNKSFNKNDKHACKVLGIPWEKNTNNYWTDKALYRRPGDTKDFCDWTKCPHPEGLPLTTISNSSLKKEFEYSLKAPSSFPASFVQELQEKGSIILKNGNFETPVNIVFELGSINGVAILPNSSKDANVETDIKDSLQQHIVETKEKCKEKIEEVKKTLIGEEKEKEAKQIGEEINNSFYRKTKDQKTTSYFSTTYIISSVALAGFIGLIVYLRRNNQLDTQLSRITDFFNNLISNKNLS